MLILKATTLRSACWLKRIVYLDHGTWLAVTTTGKSSLETFSMRFNFPWETANRELLFAVTRSQFQTLTG